MKNNKGIRVICLFRPYYTELRIFFFVTMKVLNKFINRFVIVRELYLSDGNFLLVFSPVPGVLYLVDFLFKRSSLSVFKNFTLRYFLF